MSSIWEDNFTSDPTTADLQGTGRPVVICGLPWNYDGTPLPGEWTITAGRYNTSSVGRASIGDIDGDGDFELVGGALSPDGCPCLAAYHHDGTPVAGWSPTTPSYTGSTGYGRLSLYDLDGDGRDEVIAQIAGPGAASVHALKIDGTDLPGWPYSFGTTGWFADHPSIGDIDGDGAAEVVVAARSDSSGTWSICALKANGTPAPGWPLPLPSYLDKPPVLADLDVDGALEIICGTGDGRIRVWKGDGTPVTGWPQDVGMLCTLPPVVADVDRDGLPEIVAGGSDAKVHIWRANGTPLPGWPSDSLVDLPWFGCVVGDIDGDGDMEVVVGGGRDFDNDNADDGRIYAWHHDGTAVAGFPKEVPATTCGLALTDLNADGRIDLMAACHDRRVYAWSLPGLYDPGKIEWGQDHHDPAHTGAYAPPTGGHLVRMRSVSVPSAAVSGGPVQCGAVATDSLLHGLDYSWSDAGAGGAFMPSATVQNPIYVAPVNAGPGDLLVTLTVTAQCHATPSAEDSGSRPLVVRGGHRFALSQPEAASHQIGFGASTQLTVTYVDTQGHGAAGWSWSDGGAGGAFSPSGSVQNPVYTARQWGGGASPDGLDVQLTVSAHCASDATLSDSQSTRILVKLPVHTHSVSPSASPTEVYSGGSAELNAGWRDTIGNSPDPTYPLSGWHDGGAGGRFAPTATTINPTYTAPTVAPGQIGSVLLWCRFCCPSDALNYAEGSTTLTVHGDPHTVSITASATPGSVPSGGSAAVTASGPATDSWGHTVASWSWSDGGAGGHFSPSALAQNPSYTARANATHSSVTVHLTVTATCDGPSPLEDSDTVDLTVLPIPPGVHSIGLYDGASSTFYLHNSNSAGAANLTVRFGPSGAGWAPIGGDYDADGDDTIGLYNQTTATCYLRNANAPGPADLTFRFGPAPNSWIPIAGDWDGDGDSTFGLYLAAAGTFYLRNSNNAGPADLTFRFGPTSSAWLPIAGDWNGDGVDTIGLYDPTNGTFYLRNANSAGVANLTFRFGPKPSTWKPIAGDWDKDGTETVGLYDPANGTYYLRDANSAGAANLTFRFGPKPSTWRPIAGDWDGQ